MDFSFTSDQQDLRELAAKILSDATTLERTKRVVAESDGFDRDLWAALSQADIVGISLPESVGGGGLGFLETCIVLAEVGAPGEPVPVRRWPSRHRRSRSSVPPTPRRRRRGHRHRHRRAHRGGGDVRHRRPSATGGKLTGEKVCVPAGFDAGAIVVSAIDGIYLVDPSASGVTLERAGHDARRTDGAGSCCATRRPPSSPGPRASPWL
jgi:hypothetical protein